MRHLTLLLFLALPGLSMLAAGKPDAAEKERIKYVKELGKGGSSGAQTLAGYLADESVEVRRAAAESLATIGGQAALEPLTKALDDADGEVQSTAASGLVNFYVPGYHQSGWSAKWKKGTDFLFDRFRDSEDDLTADEHVIARPEIIAGLGRVVSTSKSMEGRAAAARALGVLRGRAASDELLKALETKNTPVLYEVMTAFGKIRNRDVAPRLFYLLRDPDEKVQIAAIQTISVLGNKDANQPLREAWTRTKSEKVRRAVLEAMAMLPDEANRPLFDENLLARDEGLRAGAAEGIGRLGRPDDLARMETLWEGERKMRPRLSLAYALVNLGRTERTQLGPLQYLINTLNHDGWKEVAAAFLKDLAPKEAVRKTLHAALQDGTRSEKVLLAEILGRRGQKDSEAPLEALAQDPDPEVASESLRALRSLRMRLRQ